LVLDGEFFHRASREFLTSTSGPVRLAINANNGNVWSVEQGLQVCRGEVWRSCKENSQVADVLCILAMDFFQLLANALAFKGRQVIDK